MTPPATSHRLHTLLVVVLLAIVVGACGEASSPEQAQDDATTTQPVTTPAQAAAATPTSEPPTPTPTPTSAPLATTPSPTSGPVAAIASPTPEPVAPTPSPGSAPTGTIAFATVFDGIYVVNTDGSDLTNLTDHPAEEFHPDWSPDGTRVAFVSLVQGEPDADIYVSNADGSGLTNLTSTSSAPQSSIAWPAWSPDGTRILFVVNCGECEFRDLQPGLHVMNADGTELTNLTASADAMLTSNVWTPAWSPDGTRIAFSSGGRTINVINVDGSGLTQLTDDTYPFAEQPVWSPDGSRIAFVADLGGNREIVVMHADGTEQVNLTDSRTMEDAPAWSPDGSRIVFVARPADSPVGEIYSVSPDGADLVNLTDHPASDESPAWSPDGTRIAFVSDRDGRPGLYVMTVDGSEVTRLAVELPSRILQGLAWSP